MTLLPRVVSTAYRAWAARSSRRLAAAIAEPRRAQRGALQAIMAGLDLEARALDPELRANPVTTWEDMRPLVDRVAAGEPTALTRERVRFLEPSGGSTGGDKLVPYTPQLFAQFGNATTPWVHDLLGGDARLRRGRSYWAVSPPARDRATTAGGVPIGVPHDTDYFPPPARRLVDAVLGVPRALAHVRDFDTHRYVTLRALLALPDLALVSVWSPSFLTSLANVLDQEWPRLLRDLERGGLDGACVLDPGARHELERVLPARPGRARELRAIGHGDAAPTDLGEVWPQLALISCWVDAQAALALPAMQARVPGVRVQGKGLLATEGVTSIPLRRYEAPVAAVASHVLEFLPVDPDTGSASALLAADPTAAGSARWVHELEVGERHEVVLTTGGGLVRYRTFDVVEVVGHAEGTPTPLLRFVGRADLASDMAGEKLVPAVVERALAAARAALELDPASWALLLPDTGAAPPRYVLAVDAELDDSRARELAGRVEHALASAHHYDLCRSLGQLGPVAHLPIRDPLDAWTRACVDLGQRTGTLKPAALDPRVNLLPVLMRHARAALREV